MVQSGSEKDPYLLPYHVWIPGIHLYRHTHYVVYVYRWEKQKNPYNKLFTRPRGVFVSMPVAMLFLGYHLLPFLESP